MQHEKYMHLAIQLAKKGYGYVNPNPVVGAVIVKDCKIIGQGFHEKYGAPHAEPNAIASCTESPEGATLYVTLEPCSHHGKTPPCTEAILKSGIRRVVIGSTDPNPLVADQGIVRLKQHGINVTQGILKHACDELNQVFFHYIQTNLPYVVMKYAMTMDGKIAAHTGASKWITGQAARCRVHQDRHRYSAIMVGVGTVIADNPLLTCRLDGGENPLRIICDTHLRTPLTSKIVTTARQIPTVIATSCTDMLLHRPFIDAGCRIMQIPKLNNHLNLIDLTTRLGKDGIDSILLEGGGTLNWSALQAGIVNKVQAYLSPKLLGGSNAKTPVAGIGFPTPSDAIFLKNSTITRLDDDILIESEVQ